MDDIIINETIEPLGPFKNLRLKFSNWWERFRHFWRSLSRKQKAGLVFGTGWVVVVLVVTLFSALRRSGQLPSFIRGGPNPVFTLPAPEQPRDHDSPLSGNLITKTKHDEMMGRRPLVVVVDNHTSARPPAGLDQADLVIEALVEGGITRFLPVFWENQPEVVGPVRSIRSYHLSWIAGLNDALFMHIGGAMSPVPSANALGIIQQHGMKSLGISGRKTFWRVDFKSAPHNAYSDTKHLWEEAERIGWGGLGNIGKWKFKTDEKEENRPSEGEIKINWSTWGETKFSVRWEYDPVNNLYLREQGGAPMADEVTGEQLRAKNVVLQFSLQTLANDGTARILYQTEGTDRALVFRDGKVVEGTWEKKDRTDRTRLFNQEGEEIEFNRGVTWIEVLPLGSAVEY